MRFEQVKGGAVANTLSAGGEVVRTTDLPAEPKMSVLGYCLGFTPLAYLLTWLVIALCISELATWSFFLTLWLGSAPMFFILTALYHYGLPWLQQQLTKGRKPP